MRISHPPGPLRADTIPMEISGASEGVRTLDIHLGKVVLYQLSYARS